MSVESPVVVLSPHVDDEALGCFAFLGPTTHVVFGGIEDRPSIEVRTEELRASAQALGFSYEDLAQPVNNFAPNALIALFEAAINERKPNTVLLPAPSYNQDHRAFYEAGLIALRPHDQNHRVDRVLIYEQPHSLIWPITNESFRPSVFAPIDAEAKVAAYERYGSQVRGHRSPETVRALATFRGAHIGEPAAEAFELLRQVVNTP